MTTDTYLGQILVDGKWLDYARSDKKQAINWAKGDQINRRVVDWIWKETVIFPEPPPVLHLADFGLPRDEEGLACNLDDLPPPDGDCELNGADPAEDNNQRASFAALGLKAYAKRVGDNPIETTMSDFLGDFMHLCDAIGEDFEALVEQARFHYEPETRGVL